MIVYTMWCEWDIGINSNIWANLDLLYRDAKEALESCGIYETFEELEDEGLFGTDAIKIIEA